MTQPITNAAPLRQVSCPNCHGVSVYAPSNPFRPFCSERCQQMDLGAWASERFAVPVDQQPDDTLPITSH